MQEIYRLLKAPMVTILSCLETADNILHDDKLPIVQPVASQFYVFTSPSIPASLSETEGFVVRLGDTGKPAARAIDTHTNKKVDCGQ